MLGFYRTVFALYPMLTLAGDKIVTVDPAGRWDAVAVTRVTYGNSPLHCRLILNRTTVDTVEPFYAGDDWLKDVTIYILNRTDKTIVQGSLSLRFPETGDGTRGHPVTIENLSFGRRPDSVVVLNRQTGLPAQQDPNLKPAAFYPGQTMAIHLSDYAGQIKIGLRQSSISFATVTKCDIGQNLYIFADGMRWLLGGYSVPDADHLGKFIQINGNEYFPGIAAWPPGYHK